MSKRNVPFPDLLKKLEKRQRVGDTVHGQCLSETENAEDFSHISAPPPFYFGDYVKKIKRYNINNWNETALSQVTRAISQASFVAVDTEFTGFGSNSSDLRCPYALPLCNSIVEECRCYSE